MISLTGQPTWFTVCPLDPNLPALPKPVHYKHQRQVKSMEHLLSKFVHKAQAFAHLTTGNIKQSATLSGGFLELSSADLAKRDPNPAKPVRKAKSGHYDTRILGMLNGDMPSARHTINEAKLAKLNSIISVLRDSVDDSNDGGEVGDETGGPCRRDSTPPIPDFTNIFKMEKQVKEEKRAKQNSKKKQKSRNKSTGTMLRALREDRADSEPLSDSGNNLDDDALLRGSLNEQSMAWLASRKTNSGVSWARRHSDAFQTIPKLRESLNAGRRNRVTNYMFEYPLEVQQVAERIVRLESDNDDKEQDEGQKHQMHYKLVDTKSQAEEEGRARNTSIMTYSRPFSMPATSSPSKVSSPDCKCYPVPIEVSVHHISVVDVDREKELAKLDITRTHSVDTRPSARGHDGSNRRRPIRERVPVTSEEMEHEGGNLNVIFRPPSSKKKLRSRSVGDMELLSSDEEILLVRTPYTGQANQNSKDVHVPQGAPISSSRQEQSDETETEDYNTVDSLVPVSPEYPEAMSSLDFTVTPSPTTNGVLSPTSSPSSPSAASPTVKRREKMERQRLTFSARADSSIAARESWVLGAERPREEGKSLLKYRSLDNLVDTVPSGKRK